MQMNTNLATHENSQAALLNEFSSDLLNKILHDFPFFGAGRLLHAFQEKSSSEADTLLHKAMLYGGESQWVYFVFQQLNNPETGTIVRNITIPEKIEVVSGTLENKTENFEPKNEENTPNDNKQDLEDAILDAETLNIAADEQDALTDSNIQIALDLNQSENQSIPEKTGSEALFEPFHTVDYFASQGIRLKEEKLGDDTLGKQVKTFTQWLRSMKRIYEEQKGVLEKNEEDSVIRIADTSNKDEIVLTETMANVYLQQGKKSKAAEVYHKLSLLHPEKSSYFASLIEKLNRIQ
jgi:hypothetical protein